MVIRLRHFVRRVIGVGEFVVLRLDDPPGCDTQSALESDVFALEAAREVFIEKLVMANFVGRDAAADLL